MELPPVPLNGPGYSVVLLLEVYEDQGRVIFAIDRLDGVISLPPKAWLAIVRETVALLEHKAREARCHEMRIAGRDWSRVLRGMGWKPMAGMLTGRNGLHKLLA